MQVHALNYKLDDYENEQINNEIINHIRRHNKLEEVNRNSPMHKILADMVKNLEATDTSATHSRMVTPYSLMGGYTTPNIYQGAGFGGQIQSRRTSDFHLITANTL